MENIKKYLTRIKDLILLLLALFFLLGSIIMITEDITATIFFGIISIILFFLSKNIFIDFINYQKETKLKNDYKRKQIQLESELNLAKMNAEIEINKKKIDFQKDLELEKINIQHQETIKQLQMQNQQQLIIDSELDIIEHLPNGYAFETYIARLLEKLNYSNVQVTQSSNDYGIDVLAEKDNIKYAIQCKLYSQPVGNKAIQEAFSGKSFYNCHIAVVVTNNTFTENAKNLAKSNGVLLWDKTILQNMIKEAKINEIFE